MKILSIIKDSPLLQSIIKEHFAHNKAKHAPYHNFYHHLVVANSCNDACNFYGIHFEKRINLFVAALWHDFNHSMGVEKDDWNVKEAILQFTKWHDTLSDDVKKLIDGKIVVDIINATQYPYVIKVEDMSLFQKIIRDADLTQLAQANRIQHVYIGLSTEMKVPIEKIFEGEKPWLETITPCTDWFIPIFDKIKKEVIEECDTLLSYTKIEPPYKVSLLQPTTFPLADVDQQFIDELCVRFEHVCRGGENSKIWTGQYSTENDVVVLERGIRGPAEYYYKKDGVWHHGNYTAYKDVYTNDQLLELIITAEKENIKYEQA